MKSKTKKKVAKVPSQLAQDICDGLDLFVDRFMPVVQRLQKDLEKIIQGQVSKEPAADLHQVPMPVYDYAGPDAGVREGAHEKTSSEIPVVAVTDESGRAWFPIPVGLFRIVAWEFLAGEYILRTDLVINSRYMGRAVCPAAEPMKHIVLECRTAPKDEDTLLVLENDTVEVKLIREEDAQPLLGVPVTLFLEPAVKE
ncbi:MAG: hypothetical protein KJ648_07040 [Candidatus Omnitrophica bacterium]|nr:hypothetical protein [Candidatus Omnitrophota bacterium]MBU1767838.1 hypothetical protein [Candidatus Omnitrophota bacterium]